MPIALLALLALILVAGSAAAEEAAVTPAMAEIESIKFIAMTASVSICGIAAAYAVAKISVAAMASAAERPEILGRAILFAGLGEGIAIYGLLIAILIWITTV